MKRPKAPCTVAVVLALLLTNLNCLSFVRVAHASRADKPSHFQKARKISPLLRDDKRAPDDRVTVVATLSGQKSGRLNAFLTKNGVHGRR